jgi:hypothetical protein
MKNVNRLLTAGVRGQGFPRFIISLINFDDSFWRCLCRLSS